LLKSDFTLFKKYYNINAYGFWEKEKFILIRSKSKELFAKENNLTLAALNTSISKWKKILKEARDTRSRPNLDDKVLTSWNALMLQGSIDAYSAFGDEAYLNLAVKNANFLVENQLRKEGGLYRNFKNGKSTINAYAEDYASVIQAFISLYEVTFNKKMARDIESINGLFID
jgi:hypothetical protein